MGLSTSRFVEIQVINKTQNIILKEPRTYFLSGHSISDPQPSVLPGSSSSCRFTNSSRLWGCNGVLAYEAEFFTLAIFFSNPMDHNLFRVEMGLELSLDRVHRWDLETAYHRLARCSQGSSNTVFPCVILKENQEKVHLSAGPVTVTATVARGRSAVITVEVEERENSGSEVGIDSFMLRVAEQRDLRTYLTLIRTLRTTLRREIMRRARQALPETLRHKQNPIETSRAQQE